MEYVLLVWTRERRRHLGSQTLGTILILFFSVIILPRVKTGFKSFKDDFVLAMRRRYKGDVIVDGVVLSTLMGAWGPNKCK